MKKRTILTATILLITMSMSACGMGSNTGNDLAGIPGTEETNIVEDVSGDATDQTLVLPETPEIPDISDMEENASEDVTTEESEVNDMQGSTSETNTEDNSDNNSDTQKEPEAPKEKYTYSEMEKTMYAKSSVNVRTLPSTQGDKLGHLSKGDAVVVSAKCNETGWYRIEFKGNEGYVSGNYLVTTAPSTEPEPSVPEIPNKPEKPIEPEAPMIDVKPGNVPHLSYQDTPHHYASEFGLTSDEFTKIFYFYYDIVFAYYAYDNDPNDHWLAIQSMHCTSLDGKYDEVHNFLGDEDFETILNCFHATMEEYEYARFIVNSVMFTAKDSEGNPIRGSSSVHDHILADSGFPTENPSKPLLD